MVRRVATEIACLTQDLDHPHVFIGSIRIEALSRRQDLFRIPVRNIDTRRRAPTKPLFNSQRVPWLANTEAVNILRGDIAHHLLRRKNSNNDIFFWVDAMLLQPSAKNKVMGRVKRHNAERQFARTVTTLDIAAQTVAIVHTFLAQLRLQSYRINIEIQHNPLSTSVGATPMPRRITNGSGLSA